MFQHLHGKLLASRVIGIPTLSTNDVGIITERILDGCETKRIASLIAHSLVDYLQVRQTQMTALRAAPAYLFNYEKSWPMIEWTECDDTKTIAIFHFEEEEPEEGSWLMHSGKILAFEATTTHLWQKSRIDWNVANVGHLNTLFNVAQHMLGLLEWPAKTLEQLYEKKEITLIEYNLRYPSMLI